MAKSAAELNRGKKPAKVKKTDKSPADQEAEAKDNEVTFPVPEGLQVDGSEKGDKHDMLATFAFDGDGNMTLEAIEGIPVESKKDDEEDKADGGADEAAEGESDDETDANTGSAGGADPGDQDTGNQDQVAPDFDGQQGGFVNAMSKTPKK